jgi:GDP-L-fucose synthase
MLMEKYNDPMTINIGTGEDCTILELAELMKQVTGYPGKIATDPSKPDGTPRKVLDVSRIRALGWKHRFSLSEGLKMTYRWALETGAFEQKPSGR